jgi:membrane associated rhomboid family serine protease
MLIPLRHSQMTARRWPVITFALIALNVIAFLLTNSALEEDSQKLSEAKVHILMLAAAHPEVTIQEPARDFVEKFKEAKPKVWKELQRPDRPIEDAFDARIRAFDFMSDIQVEMDTLAAQYAELQANSITQKYAFILAEHKPLTYLTSMFLHGGWMHLIGNMWFLWLAGFVLEDVWGRPLYAVFYLIAGFAATQFYLWTNPGSLTPTLGASGAVAALMGAFLVRYPKLKIEMAWILILGFRLRFFRFNMAAYWLLPLWLASEIFSGTLFGTSSGVAHWAHVGGFVAGAIFALMLKFTGVDAKMNKAIDAEVSWQAAPEIVQATELLDTNNVPEAIEVLETYLQEHPDSVDACVLLEQAFWRTGEVHAYHDTVVRSIELYLKTNDGAAALNAFDAFVQSNGDREQLSPATWLKLARAAEAGDRVEQALNEYKLLAQSYPEHKESLQAQLAAAKLCLKKLAQPQSALQFFEAASASPVPHLDWQSVIDAGIKECRAAVAAPVAALAAKA